MTNEDILRTVGRAVDLTAARFSIPSRVYRRSLTRDLAYKEHVGSMLSRVLTQMALELEEGDATRATQLIQKTFPPRA